MGWEERITVTLGVRSGKPGIKGTRITVYDVLEYLAGGMTEDEILADFPSLTRLSEARFEIAQPGPTHSQLQISTGRARMIRPTAPQLNRFCTDLGAVPVQVLEEVVRAHRSAHTKKAFNGKKIRTSS